MSRLSLKFDIFGIRDSPCFTVGLITLLDSIISSVFDVAVKMQTERRCRSLNTRAMSDVASWSSCEQTFNNSEDRSSVIAHRQW